MVNDYAGNRAAIPAHSSRLRCFPSVRVLVWIFLRIQDRKVFCNKNTIRLTCVHVGVKAREQLSLIVVS